MAAAKGDSKARIGLTVMFSPEERQMIRRAVVETDTRSASEFIREAAVKAATKAQRKAA
jgi:uncharacterized protein (DUF1778 family)